MVSVLAQLALTAIMLSTGSLNTISKKILYQTKGQTIDPDIIQKYQRPWFCTFIMFCGEAMCMLFFYCFALYYHCTDKHKDRDSMPGISEITSTATADQPKQGITFVSSTTWPPRRLISSIAPRACSTSSGIQSSRILTFCVFFIFISTLLICSA